MAKLMIMIGGAGFLGKSILNYGRGNKDWNIIVIDQALANYKLKLEIESNQYNWPLEIKFLDIDLSKEDLIDKWTSSLEDLKFTADSAGTLFPEFDEIHIFNFASPVGVDNHKEATFYKAMTINQNVFRFANFYIPHIRPIINNTSLYFWYSSTSEIYGLYDQKDNAGTGNLNDIKLHTFYDETDMECGFRSDYIYQKVLGEKLFEQLCNNYEIHILRLFNIVGKFQDPNKGVFPKFINNILEGKETNVNSNIRCYTRVSELYDYITDQMNYTSDKTITIKNIVNYNFENSLTSEELYLYLFAFIKKKFPDKEIVANYNNCNIVNEISVRGSQKTLSYTRFCREFGGVIENIIDYKSVRDGILKKVEDSTVEEE